MGQPVLVCLAIHISRQTVLRMIRTSSQPQAKAARCIGVDDWCSRRGIRYGTLIVDLETQRAIDRLPDREADTLADWLTPQRDIAVVSRDRSRRYAEGIRWGAPHAQQVADRWHLLQNLGDILRHVCEQHAATLRQIGIEPLIRQESRPSIVAPQQANKSSRVRPLRPDRQARLNRRAHWEAVFQQARTLLDAGMSVSAVARQLGIDRSTIGKYQHLAALPPRTCVRLQPRLLNPFRAYLRDRVLEANPTAPRLLAEIQAMGFTGRKGLVQTYLRQVRTELGFTHHAAGSPYFQTQPAKTLPARLLQHCVMLLPARLAHPHFDRAVHLTLPSLTRSANAPSPLCRSGLLKPPTPA